MGERLAGVAGAGVGHQRDPADLEPDPARGDALEDGRHADRVPAERGQHPDLGRRLVGRPGQADVDALGERHALGGAGGVQPLAQPRAPGVGQVREARPELVRVRADERAPPGQVDVVAHDHQRARPEARVEPARRVGQDHDPGPEPALNSSTGWMTSPGSLPSYRWKRPWSMTTGAPPSRPRRSRPAWPAPSRPASRAAPRTGSRPGPRDRPRGRPGPSRGRCRPRARGPSVRRTAATSAASRAGCSIGGMGRDGSTGRVGSGVSVEGDIGPPARIDRRRSEAGSFAGPTRVSTPGCRSRPVGRATSLAVVRRRPSRQ